MDLDIILVVVRKVSWFAMVVIWRNSKKRIGWNMSETGFLREFLSEALASIGWLNPKSMKPPIQS